MSFQVPWSASSSFFAASALSSVSSAVTRENAAGQAYARETKTTARPTVPMKFLILDPPHGANSAARGRTLPTELSVKGRDSLREKNQPGKLQGLGGGALRHVQPGSRPLPRGAVPP